MIFATLSRVLLVPVRYWFPRLAYQVVQYETPAQAHPSKECRSPGRQVNLLVITGYYW